MANTAGPTLQFDPAGSRRQFIHRESHHLMDYPSRILIADDEPPMRFTLEQVLKREGHHCVQVTNGEEAVQAIRAGEFQLVILDMKMPKMDGMEALRQIRKIAPIVPVVMMTAFGNRELAMQALRLGAHDYFNKPFDIDELRVVVRRVLERQQLLREIMELREQLSQQVRFDRLIGASPAMQQVMQLLRRVCVSEVTVLIHGESGTGKELIAQALHHGSPRRDEPFVSINCAAIPENLLESELFGHEKGAFTGAIAQKPGRFELADKGTIFLDEIGDMPQPLQAKMLRVLQERVVERVGGTRPVPVDVRVVAATNRNLQMEVAEGRFREDLFFRLNVVPITLPPLRERGQDILLLAEHFLKVYSQKFSRAIQGFAPDAADALLRYGWPGNVRELENAIQRGIILSSRDVITLEDLPPTVACTSPAPSDPAVPAEDDLSIPLQDRVAAVADRYEKTAVIVALQKCGFHRQETANRLGISRKSLHNKMLKYGLFDSEEEREYRTGNTTGGDLE